MHDKLKKLTEDIRVKLMAAISSDTVKSLITNTKAAKAEDTGAFSVIASTADIDRQGESIKQDGWDLTHFMNNPVMLWAHDYASLPVGIAESAEVVNGELVIKGRFAPVEANPFAQQVRKLYDLGMINTVSVGFIPREVDGDTITKAELLEVSFVPVPANPFALAVDKVKKLGINVMELAFKGINFEVKAEPVAPVETPATPEPSTPPTEGMEAKADGDEGTVAPEAEDTAILNDDEDTAGKAKGEVADQLNDADKRKKKWENISKVDQIMGAFYNAYFADETEVEAFDTLIVETAELMKGLAAGSEPVQNSVSKSIGAEADAKYLQLISEKVGRVLSKKNKEVVTTAIEAMKGATTALDSLLKADDEQGSEGKDSGNGAAPNNQRSGTSVSEEEALKALHAWLSKSSEQQVLKDAATALSNVLGTVNKIKKKK